MFAEWPIDDDVPARRAPPRPYAPRGKGALLDLLLPEDARLTERVRAASSAMLDAVTGRVERDMRLHLAARIAAPAELSASLSAASVAIAMPLLRDGDALRDPPFLSLLIRRAQQHALAERIVGSGAVNGNLLIASTDDAVAAAAMRLLIAESQRLDRFGDPTILFDDLPAETAHWLVWVMAAALRHYLFNAHAMPNVQADALLTEAAAHLLGGHDEGSGLEAGATRLALALGPEGPASLAALLGGGEVIAFTAVLALANGLTPADTWETVAAPVPGRLAALLRAAGAPRDDAAAIILALRDGDAATREMSAFDTGPDAEVTAALATLALPVEYRSAIARIDTGLAWGEGAS